MCWLRFLPKVVSQVMCWESECKEEVALPAMLIKSPIYVQFSSLWSQNINYHHVNPVSRLHASHNIIV